MGDLVDKIVRVMCAENHVDPDEYIEMIGATRGKGYEGFAKTVIAAVLGEIAEPTEAMQNAGAVYRAHYRLSSSAEVYRAMIAALKKELEGG